ncbi:MULTISPECIES: TonB-dependent receptor [unclassified Phenylobacterium]|uniref:TonB-dependent receptor n=1 Tax=unclassified Phenylobacterium TaxID=2640670 RepID=UPI00083B17BA|nr:MULTISPECIES: TonB-dependent receptor [unclassified Phenylobacterium]
MNLPRTLLWRAALATLMCSVSHAAFAQTEAAADAVDEVVVTGVRAALRSAAEQKRTAEQVIDSVTAEDIGKFPTTNVAESAQRITGVQITRTRGEGTGASIRGLPTDFTRVQLNDSTLSSATVDLRGGGGGGNITRAFDFRLLPTEFVSTLEVTKSPTADMQEGGLSGVINVRTVRPFDLSGFKLVGSAFGVQNSNSGKETFRVSGLVSDIFLDGRLGVLLAGGYNKEKPETHGINNVGWTNQPEATNRVDYNGDGDLLDVFNISTQSRTEIARENRSRLAFAGVAEYKAAEALTLSVEGFYSKFDVLVESLENLNLPPTSTGAVITPTQLLTIPGVDASQLAFGEPHAIVLGQSATDVRANDRVNDSVSRTGYVKVGAEYEGEDWRGAVSLAHSDSRQVGNNLNLAQTARFGVTTSCLPTETICGIAIAPGSQTAYLDPNQGIVASLNGAYKRKTSDRVDELRADLSREFDAFLLTRVSAGAVVSRRKTNADGRTLVVQAAQLAPLAGLSRSTVNPNGFNLSQFTQLVQAGNGSFLGTYNGDQPFPTQWVASDTLKLIETLGLERLAAVPGAVQENLNTVIDVKEEIAAFYVQANFATEDDRVSGNFGVRVVRTELSSRGVSPDLTGIRVLVDAGGTTTVPPAAPIAARNTYTEVLPSANVRLELTDDLQLRVAASRTMARPALVQLSPSTTINCFGGTCNLTANNPDLKPFISNNFDASVEWYPDPDTSVTVAVFAKDLQTLVRPQQDIVQLPVTFFTASTNTTEVRQTNVNRTRPTNQKGVTLKGFEIGYQQVFTFLPGLLENLGLQANYTFISNSDSNVLTAASKHNFNVSAFYETEKFGARLSYTWRDKFVSSGLPDGNNGLGIVTQSRGDLSVNLTYNFDHRISIVAEGVNMLDDVDKTRTNLGNLPQDYFDPGRQLLLGVRVAL